MIDQRVDEVIASEIETFAAKWGVNPEALKAFADTTPASSISPQTVNPDLGSFDQYKAAGGTNNKLRYLRELRQAVSTFIKDEIKPFMRR